MNMHRVAAALALASLSASTLAQSYPVKPIRMVVAIAPGGGLDAGARLTSAKLSEVLGQPVVVENRPGAGSTIGAAAVAAAAPDGYTLHYSGTSLLIAPALYKKLTFDPVTSFTAVGGVCWEQLVLAVNPSMPVKSTSELIALLKSNPGKYSFASPGVGSPHHLSMELFKKQAGVDTVHVPYKGAGPILPDLIGGTVHIAIMSAAATVPQAKAGKVRAIAVTRPVKIAIAPDWPAIAEVLPGFEAYSRHFIVAPSGTSPDVVGRLSAALSTALSSEETRQAYVKQGAMAEYVGPAVLAERIRNEVQLWGAIARESGATLD
jgi:tripartite-type tricarboxylate transporter receptor subunit TctC